MHDICRGHFGPVRRGLCHIDNARLSTGGERFLRQHLFSLTDAVSRYMKMVLEAERKEKNYAKVGILLPPQWRFPIIDILQI